MKKLSFLCVLAVFVFSSCGKPTTSNVSTNNKANLANSNANQPILNTNNSTNILSNSNSVTQTNSEVNAEMMKQIELQQHETADPRKAANKSTSGNNNQPPTKTSGSSPRQTW